MNIQENSAIKEATKKVWGTNPAGWTHARDKQKGTKEFFDQVLKNRFTEECFWLPAVVSFESYANKKVLEIGCGAGYDAYMFCKNGAEYTGIDLVPENIVLTKKHLSFYGYSPLILEADAEKMGFKEQFDLVYSFGVLHHIPNIEKALLNSYDALKPGGTAMFIVYYKYSIAYFRVVAHWIVRGKFLKESLDHALSRVEDVGSSERPLVRVYSKKEFTKLVQAAGFTVVSTKIRKLSREDFPAFRGLAYSIKYIPETVLYRWATWWGWYLCVEAVKSDEKGVF